MPTENEQFEQNLRDALMDINGETSQNWLVRSGISAQAAELGIEKVDLNRRVNRISSQINWDRLLEIKDEIKDLATRQNKPLTSDEREDFVKKAGLIDIRREYVLDNLIPQVLDNLELPAQFDPEIIEPNQANELAKENTIEHIFEAIILPLTESKSETISAEAIALSQSAELEEKYVIAGVFEKKAKLVNFSLNTKAVKRGEMIDINWEVSNTKAVHISGVGNGLPPKGTRKITPLESSSYILSTAEGKALGQQNILVEMPRKSFPFENLIWVVVLLAIVGSCYLIYEDYQQKNEAKQPGYLQGKTTEIRSTQKSDFDKSTKTWKVWEKLKTPIVLYVETATILVSADEDNESLSILSRNLKKANLMVFTVKEKNGTISIIEHYFETNLVVVSDSLNQPMVQFKP